MEMKECSHNSKILEILSLFDPLRVMSRVVNLGKSLGLEIRQDALGYGGTDSTLLLLRSRDSDYDLHFPRTRTLDPQFSA